MSASGIYHRLGEAGGPGCAVVVLPVQGRGAGGSLTEAALLDAGPEATEVALLRTVAHGLGVRWGQDDFGWWAMVPAVPVSAFAAKADEGAAAAAGAAAHAAGRGAVQGPQGAPVELPSAYALYREDDNGARFLIESFPSRTAAEQRAAELARRGHKQHYYVEPVGNALTAAGT